MTEKEGSAGFSVKAAFGKQQSCLCDNQKICIVSLGGRSLQPGGQTRGSVDMAALDGQRDAGFPCSCKHSLSFLTVAPKAS